MFLFPSIPAEKFRMLIVASFMTANLRLFKESILGIEHISTGII